MHLNRKLQLHKEGMLSTYRGVPNGKSVVEHYSILAQKAIVFPQELLPTWTQDQYYRNGELNFS